MPRKKEQNKLPKQSWLFEPITAVLCLSFILRLISLNQSLWLDEATTALTTHLSFSQIISSFGATDFHPPLYYLLLKATSAFIGTSEIALRLPSVIAGVLSIYVLYRIGTKLFNKQVAVVSSILLATSSLHIYYSQEARMYAFATLFVLLAIFFWLQSVSLKKIQWWILYSLSLVLAVGTDYLTAAIILPLFLATLINYRKYTKYFVISLIPLILAGLVYCPIFLAQLTAGMGVKANQPGWWNILGQTGIKNLALVPVKFLIGRISFANKIVYGTFVLLIAALVGKLLIQARTIKNTKIVFLWLLVPLVFLAIVGLFVPVFVYFRVLFCLPALYLLCAVGINAAKEDLFLPLLSFFLIANLVTSYMYLSNSKFHRENWKGLAQTVTEESKDGTALTVFVANSQMEAYDYYNPPVKAIPGSALEEQPDTLWLMRYVQDVFDPQETVLHRVEDLGYVKEKELDFNGIVVWKYKSHN